MISTGYKLSGNGEKWPRFSQKGRENRPWKMWFSLFGALCKCPCQGIFLCFSFRTCLNAFSSLCSPKTIFFMWVFLYSCMFRSFLTSFHSGSPNYSWAYRSIWPSRIIALGRYFWYIIELLLIFIKNIDLWGLIALSS